MPGWQHVFLVDDGAAGDEDIGDMGDPCNVNDFLDGCHMGAEPVKRTLPVGLFGEIQRIFVVEGIFVCKLPSKGLLVNSKEDDFLGCCIHVDVHSLFIRVDEGGEDVGTKG